MQRDVTGGGLGRRTGMGASAGRRSTSLCLVLAVLSVLAAVAVVLFPSTLSHSVFVPLLVAAGIFQSGRALTRSLLVVLGCYGLAASLTWRADGVHTSVLAVTMAVLSIILFVARRRWTAQVSLSDGTGLLSELRERLDRQALVPELTDDFAVDSCVLPASGQAFSGDFMAAARHGDVLDLALTDVSGHGHAAGMRALLLSGAISGLLGQVPADHLLPAANRYLVRQGWRDGFASCIHLNLDMGTGAFEIGTAGHPSAIHFRADSNRWHVQSEAAGLLLGLFDLEPGDYSRARGVLEPGDVLVLYTDGVVEGRDGNTAAGVDRLMLEAGQAVQRGPAGSAERICRASLAAGGDDDRSVVVVTRRA